MAEAILNSLGGGRFRAFSAGTGYSTPGVRSKALKGFTGLGAPSIDFVITLCDAAAGASCPVFPGSAVRALWAHPGPSRGRRPGRGGRVQGFTSLPYDSVDKLALKRMVHEAG
jgi:protein-tyrosine-phosphatase